MPMQLILELVLAMLLVVTASYCYLLNRRLKEMRNGNDGLRETVRTLNEAALRAQDGVEQLRSNSTSLAQELSGKIKLGRELASELAMIIDSGNNIANRITSQAAQARVENRKPAPREALSRLDKEFRRQFSGEMPPNESSTAKDGKNISSQTSLIIKTSDTQQPPNGVAGDAGNELRQALRAVR